ncbi:hypothetical protein L9F63_007053, partial [Diploptera punctata]
CAPPGDIATVHTIIPIHATHVPVDDCRGLSGETSGNYKPHDHGLQPENLLQDHHSNSGRESLHRHLRTLSVKEYSQHTSGPFCPGHLLAYHY